MALLVKKVEEQQTVSNTPFEWRAFKDGVEFEIYGNGHPLYIGASAIYSGRIQNVDVLDMTEDVADIYQHLKITGTYLVKDWKGITDENGEPLEVTPENFVAVFNAVPEVWEFIRNAAADIPAAHNEKISNTKKKPSSATNGKKSTAA